jgi:sugar phosphate isomerase/epimerase
MTETDLVDQAVAMGLSCLQIGDNLPLHTLSDERLHSLTLSLAKHSLRIEVGARGLTAKNFADYLSISHQLNAPLLRFVIDGPAHQLASQDVIELIKDFLPDLKNANTLLGIENHDRFKAKELAIMMEAVGSDQVGICLDCVNSMGAGEGLEYVADVLSPYTVNLHIKDFAIKRLPHKMGFTVTGAPAGTGLTNVPLLMEKLAKYNRCQSAVLEQWVPWQSSLEETIHTEKKWAEQSISYLKSLSYFKQQS